MAYYTKPPELRTRARNNVSFLGPVLQTGRVVVSAPSWLGAQQGRIVVPRARLWNRIPLELAEDAEPSPSWDVVTRGL